MKALMAATAHDFSIQDALFDYLEVRYSSVRSPCRRETRIVIGEERTGRGLNREGKALLFHLPTIAYDIRNGHDKRLPGC